MSALLTRLSITQRIAIGLALLVLLGAFIGVANLLASRSASDEFQKFAKLNEGYRVLLDIERDASELQRLILAYRLSPNDMVLDQLRESLAASQALFEQVEASAVGELASELYEPMARIYGSLPEHIDSLGLIAGELSVQQGVLRDLFVDAVAKVVSIDHLLVTTDGAEHLNSAAQLQQIFDAEVTAESYLRTHEYALQERFLILIDDSEEYFSRLALAAEEQTAQQAGDVSRLLIELKRAFNLLIQIDRNLIFHTNVVIAGNTNELNRLSADIRNFIATRQAQSVLSVRVKLERARQVVLLVFACLVFAAFAIALWLGRSVIRPVNAVTDAIEQLGRGVALEHVPGSERKDEIGLLARAGEALRDAHQRTAQLLDQSEALTRDLMRREEQLKASNTELDNFAYVASHDLRSPLRAIDNLAQWIEEDCAQVLPDTSKQHFDLLRSRVKRMEQLLEDLLAYSRVGRLESPVEQLSLADVVTEAIDLVNVPEACTVSVTGTMPSLTSRRVPLRQVIQNLISNAVKYNDKDRGEVVFSVDDVDDDFVEFSVSDNGPGIAPEYHEKIFSLFTTLQSRDDVESSGMGLAIVRKVIKSKRGSITLDSAEGRGSRFTVRWPLTPADEDTHISDIAEGSA